VVENFIKTNFMQIPEIILKSLAVSLIKKSAPLLNCPVQIILYVIFLGQEGMVISYAGSNSIAS